VPPTYEIDQYTGKNVTDKAGYVQENKSLIITIKNQAFSSSFNGTKYYLAYNVGVKGHFGDEWKGLDFKSRCTMKYYLSEGYPRASNSDYTRLYVPANNYPADTQLDVKVQAYMGHGAVLHIIDYLEGHIIPIPTGEHDEDGIIFDEASDWSEIQTITINKSTSKTNPKTPSQSETEPAQQDTEPETAQLTLIVAVALISIPVAAGLGLLIYLTRKQKR
jgi:hypothetical protein